MSVRAAIVRRAWPDSNVAPIGRTVWHAPGRDCRLAAVPGTIGLGVKLANVVWIKPDRATWHGMVVGRPKLEDQQKWVDS